MHYTPEHAARALKILEDLLPLVTSHPEYEGLVAILQDSSRWHEAHDQFTAIRVNITLKNEAYGKSDLDSKFAYVAENAAKTAYNCSGSSAPFDDDSFNWLLRCQQSFLYAIPDR
ncbi:MAG: hypothetical protein WCP16_11675 [Pseudanabaena sp. ELA645]|jgi:hypothetical protein